ncbi:MAG: DUF4125 family protein [Lachnospiraceae bacterium]|nr:DUF4125 family protein [Lachnospiraceae bacterium]
MNDERKEELIEELIKVEYALFDRVDNEGGRAACQDDYLTFYAMRKSQYLTWNIETIESLYNDMVTNRDKGRNLVTEKYARMMESTAPEEYKKIEALLPKVGDEAKKIIESVVAIEVEWMEAFAKVHPNISMRARNIRTATDTPYETSAETYLRGELMTYSMDTLYLYARRVVELYKEGANMIEMTMFNTIKMYGYERFEDVK